MESRDGRGEASRTRQAEGQGEIQDQGQAQGKLQAQGEMSRSRGGLVLGLIAAVGILLTKSVMAQEHPPKILEIYREPVNAGSERAYRAIEEDGARICADMKFPHSHLAIESLSGPKEVWWLNGFESAEDKEQAYRAYAKNPALVAALEGHAKRKKALTGTGADIFADYDADSSQGAIWSLVGARFFVVTVTRRNLTTGGPVFVAPDGTRYILRPVRTRQQADALAARAGPDTVVFAVRPYFGMPAREWIAADPEFWKSNPMATVK